MWRDTYPTRRDETNSSSILHNIIKRFRETGEISVRKGQGWRPLLDARGLLALRQYCITNDSVIEINKWAQEYFQKPLSVNTIHHAICRYQLKLYHAKRKPCENMVQKRCRVGQGSFKMDCFKVEMCSMVRPVQIWHSCWKSRVPCPLGSKGRRPSSVLSAFSSRARISDGMGVHKCIRYGQLACFGRH